MSEIQQKIDPFNDKDRMIAGGIFKGTLAPFHPDVKYHVQCGGLCRRYFTVYPHDKKGQVEAGLRLHWFRHYAKWWCPKCHKCPPMRYR